MTTPERTPDSLIKALASLDRADHRDLFREVMRTGVLPNFSSTVLNDATVLVLYTPKKVSLNQRIQAWTRDGKIDDISSILEMGSDVRNGSPNVYKLVRTHGDEAYVTNAIEIIGSGRYEGSFFSIFKPQLLLAKGSSVKTIPCDELEVLRQARLERKLRSLATYIEDTDAVRAGTMPAKHYEPQASIVGKSFPTGNA